MKKLIKRFREWRDRRFRERIDRVYFNCDAAGNRFLRGNLYVAADGATGATGQLCAADKANICGDLRASGNLVAGKDVVAFTNASLGMGIRELSKKSKGSL